jgi:hypothetical protein
MGGRIPFQVSIICIFITLRLNGLDAQEPALPGVAQEEARRNPVVPCLEPPPLVRWEDYHGPLKRAEGLLARKLERKAVRVPRFKPDILLCSLETKDKFTLFLHDTFEPISFVSAGFNAGMDQAADRDPGLGLGGAGYGRRFGIDFAAETTWRFLKGFAYPTIFSEDPRYYRLGRGSRGKRLLHAAAHSFVAFRDDGKHMFNFTEWLGSMSAAALENTYHPGDDHTVAAVLKQTGYSVGVDVGFDVLREFWPEVARKLKIPFRDMAEKQRIN